MLKFSGYPYLIRGQPERGVLRRAAAHTHRATEQSTATLGDGRPGRTAFEARGDRRGAQYPAGLEWCNDARTGMPPGIPGGAMCVQRFDDSLNSAIHITYRISLRSSSMPEPRDPLLKVLFDFAFTLRRSIRQGVRGPVGAPARGRVAPQVRGGWEVWGRRSGRSPHSVMIPPQVHLRRPCYDFYFL